MTIITLLVGVAVPAYRNAMEAAHAASAKSDFAQSLLGVVTHAVAGGTAVVLCPGTTAGCSGNIDWSHGWVSFADVDGDRRLGPYDVKLRTQGSLGGRVHLRSTAGRTRLIFQPSGQNPGSNVTFTLCDGRGPSRAMTLILANDGRLRTGKPSAASAAACMQAM